jgi:hypothetical protein
MLASVIGPKYDLPHGILCGLPQCRDLYNHRGLVWVQGSQWEQHETARACVFALRVATTDHHTPSPLSGGSAIGPLT